jgi:hypothetical protein
MISPCPLLFRNTLNIIYYSDNYTTLEIHKYFNNMKGQRLILLKPVSFNREAPLKLRRCILSNFVILSFKTPNEKVLKMLISQNPGSEISLINMNKEHISSRIHER